MCMVQLLAQLLLYIVLIELYSYVDVGAVHEINPHKHTSMADRHDQGGLYV